MHNLNLLFHIKLNKKNEKNSHTKQDFLGSPC